MRPRQSPSSTRRRTHRAFFFQIFVQEHRWKYGHGLHGVCRSQAVFNKCDNICRPDEASMANVWVKSIIRLRVAIGTYLRLWRVSFDVENGILRLVTLHSEDDGKDCNSFHLRFCPVEGHLWKVAFLVTQIEGSSRVRGWWYRQSDFGFVLPCQTTGTRPLALARTIVAQLLGPDGHAHCDDHVDGYDDYGPDGQALGGLRAHQLVIDRSHLVVLHVVGAHLGIIVTPRIEIINIIKCSPFAGTGKSSTCAECN